MKIHVDDLGRMRADLTLVLALVAAVDVPDHQAPVVRILELGCVPRVSSVCVLAHRQQVHLFAVVLSAHPGYLRPRARRRGRRIYSYEKIHFHWLLIKLFDDSLLLDQIIKGGEREEVCRSEDSPGNLSVFYCSWNRKLADCLDRARFTVNKVKHCWTRSGLFILSSAVKREVCAHR